MKRVALFLVCFVVSTGIVVWLVGGIRSPLKPEDDRVPPAQPRDDVGGKLHPLMNPETRGIYIGTVSGGELNRYEEIIHEDGTVEHIPRETFRYDSAEPSSSKLGVVQGLTGTFYDNKGFETAHVTSDHASVRLDEKSDEVSRISLEGNVRFEERQGPVRIGSLETPALEIRFASSAASTADGESPANTANTDTKERTPTPSRPVLSSDELVTIRKDGMLLRGTGFHGDVELRDFRIGSDVELVVESDAGLSMPDMLGRGDDDASGPSWKIESPGSLILRGSPAESPEGAAPAKRKGSWGVSEATVLFTDRTILSQGEQRLEVGALEIGLQAVKPADPKGSAASDPKAREGRGNLQAKRLFGSSGVVFRDGQMEARSRTIECNAGDEPTLLTLAGSPRIVMSQEGGPSLFGESGSDASGLITVECSDRIELRSDPAAARRHVQCFGDVRIYEGRTFDPAKPGLSSDHITLVIDESGDVTQLEELVATGSVEIRDPEFVLTGGRFELVRSGKAQEFDLVMSRRPELRLSGAPIQGFQMDLLPGAGSDGDAETTDASSQIVASAVDKIVVSRETETTTLIDFLGGFTMERRVEDDLLGKLTSESMLLSMQKDEAGKSRLASWNASGDVHYESPEGEAVGDHLSYSKSEGRVRLLGTRGAHRAILRFTDPDGGEPQRLLAETFVYIVDSDAFEAEGRVEGEFTTDAVAWEALARRGDEPADGEADAAKDAKADANEATEPPQRWILKCDEADIALVRAEESDDETTRDDDATDDAATDEDRGPSTQLAYFDARGRVRLDGESQRVRAEQVTYSAVKNNVLVRGTEAEPALLSTRDETLDRRAKDDVSADGESTPRPEEWSSVASSWFDIDTENEVVRCEDGGLLTFHVEDLLSRDRTKTPERLVTTISCTGLMEFRRDRDASFHDDVRVTQIGAGDTPERPRTKLECGYMHVALEPEPSGDAKSTVVDPRNATDAVGGLRVRKLTCEHDVVVRHKNPNVVASGEYLELVTRETMIYVHGGNKNVFFRHEDGTFDPKSLRYDYKAGKVEVWQFSYTGRRASQERN